MKLDMITDTWIMELVSDTWIWNGYIEMDTTCGFKIWLWILILKWILDRWLKMDKNVD
jgi:hypothetical protein